MSWFDKLGQMLGGKKSESQPQKPSPETSEAPAAPAPPKDTRSSAEKLLTQLTIEYLALQPQTKISACASVKDVLECDAATQREIILLACDWLLTERYYAKRDALKQVCRSLFTRVQFSEDDLCILLKMATNNRYVGDYPYPSLITLCEKFFDEHGPQRSLYGPLSDFAKMFDKLYGAESRRTSQRIKLLIERDSNEKVPAGIIRPNEPWADFAREELTNMPEEKRQSWLTLLKHATKCSGTSPSRKWLDKIETLIDAVGRDEFVETMGRWFPLVRKFGKSSDTPITGEMADPAELICPENTEVLKGLVWGCSLLENETLPALLADLAECCFKKVTWHGARCPKVANACVGVLSTMKGQTAIAQLGRLQSGAKKQSARGQIEKALQNAATKAGMTVEDLQESSVPTFDFQEIGRTSTQVGDYTANIIITGVNDVELNFATPEGKQLKTIPAAIKKDHADELKALKRKVTDIEKLLPSIRHRIEHSLLEQRQWNFTGWKERYLDHPIAGAIGRRLIWSFNGRPGIFHEGNLVDSAGTKVEIDPDATMVELWHPISAETDAVAAWRKWLHEHQVTQPFKQAHREIYVLTDAERETATYSNRFAAHIIRQHQFTELLKQRGWRYTLQGQWDSFNTPTLSLPRWNMRVEFWVDAANIERTSDMGIFLYLATDQVKFIRPEGVTIPLTEILPIVFTEVMRDVDLFVGVCSIGNDPTWQDHGEQQTFQYWNNFSFGDLSGSAVSRKQTLEEIVPYLKIAPRCSFTDKFLVVKGDLRTYKIHCGSGNILMEPNDQYLCIVQGRGASDTTEKVFLPFEGDSVLSIILSKAFLLADDKKIKDRSILSQIMGERRN